MRYPASEKLEIIRLVEQSHLPVRRTLEKLGIQPARFYRWYDRLQTGGPEALEDKASRLSLLKISTGLRETGDFHEPTVPLRSWWRFSLPLH
jgi:transposase-like protein